jgi:hypothetical protein
LNASNDKNYDNAKPEVFHATECLIVFNK